MTNLEFYKEDIKRKLCDFAFNRAICEVLNVDYAIDEYKLLDWLCEEYKEPILTDSEREYLKIVFKPFHKRIEYITKAEDGDGESIDYMYDEEHAAWFPPFEKGTMYKNMELYKWYTLEELGITYDD